MSYGLLHFPQDGEIVNKVNSKRTKKQTDNSKNTRKLKK